mgnify:CR=1 FL=1
MPHDIITVTVWLARSSFITCSPVTGLTPRLANVAAMTAASSAVTRREQARVYASSATLGLFSMMFLACSVSAIIWLFELVAISDW